MFISMYSILGWVSFCMNYCINAAWHGGNKPVTLLGCNEAQVALTVAFRSSALLGLVSLIFLLTIPHRFSMAIKHSNTMVIEPAFGTFGSVGIYIYIYIYSFISSLSCKCLPSFSSSPLGCHHDLYFASLPSSHVILLNHNKKDQNKTLAMCSWKHWSLTLPGIWSSPEVTTVFDHSLWGGRSGWDHLGLDSSRMTWSGKLGQFYKAWKALCEPHVDVSR